MGEIPNAQHDLRSGPVGPIDDVHRRWTIPAAG